MTEQPAGAPLAAHTFNEVCYYLAVAPCDRCGKGPWEIDRADGPNADSHTAKVAAHCRNCSESREFEFTCGSESPADGAEAETINPTAEPSRIIDLAQWLSLFHMLAESAAEGETPAATRRKGYQAALCLAEALKFYGDDELPPPSAFFTPATAEIFRQHPERFARQRLRDIQSKLPALATMARHVDRDDRAARKRWWQFWRK